MIDPNLIDIQWRVIPGQRGHREATATLKLQASVQVTLGEDLLEASNFRKTVESNLRRAILETLYGPKDIPVAPRIISGINGDNNPIH